MRSSAFLCVFIGHLDIIVCECVIKIDLLYYLLEALQFVLSHLHLQFTWN